MNGKKKGSHADQARDPQYDLGRIIADATD